MGVSFCWNPSAAPCALPPPLSQPRAPKQPPPTGGTHALECACAVQTLPFVHRVPERRRGAQRRDRAGTGGGLSGSVTRSTGGGTLPSKNRRLSVCCSSARLHEEPLTGRPAGESRASTTFSISLKTAISPQRAAPGPRGGSSPAVVSCEIYCRSGRTEPDTARTRSEATGPGFHLLPLV